MYRVALVPVTILILVGSQLGMAQAALDYVIEKASLRGITHTNYGEAARVHGLPDPGRGRGDEDRDRASARVRAADDLDACAAAGRHPDLRERARVRADSALVAKYCREAVEILVSAHGTSSMADSNRLQRLWRDVHVASRHAITEWQVNLEIYGKALLGVEPNITPLI